MTEKKTLRCIENISFSIKNILLKNDRFKMHLGILYRGLKRKDDFVIHTTKYGLLS